MDIQATLDKLSENLLLAEPNDLNTLADLHTLFQEVAEWAHGEGAGEVASAAASSGDLMESIILEEAGDPAAALDRAMKTVEAMVAVVRDGLSPSEAGLGGEDAGAGTEGDAGEEDLLPVPPPLPPHIDEALFGDFLARQPGILDEMEEHILALERGTDDASLGALKRALHTLKGESALLGLTEIERLCHATEDALGDVAPATLTDYLLSMRDWLARAFEAYEGKGPAPEGVNTIMGLLREAAAPGSGDTPPATAENEPAAPDPAAAGEQESVPLEGDLGLLGDFVAEATEHLENADVHLLTLETEPQDAEALNAVFRAFHTIKGVAGFLALGEVQSVAHEAENLLDRSRKGELELSGPAIDVTFDAVDMLKKLMANVSEALASGGLLAREPASATLIDRIRAVLAGEAPAETAGQAAAKSPANGAGRKLGEILVDSGLATEEGVEKALRQQAFSDEHARIGEVLCRLNMATRKQVEEALAIQKGEGARRKLGEILEEMGVATREDIEEALRKQQAPSKAPKLGEALVASGEVAARDVAQALRAQKAQPLAAAVKVKEAVKVDADRLDWLVDMIGELVIAEAMVTQSEEISRVASPELQRHLSQLAKITRELQEVGTALRMVPVRGTFQKMARLVRDVAKKASKEVEFVMTGEDTELDKSVVDKIGDPLVHMVRNAVDHGLEASPDDRVKAGKPPAGRVELRAHHKGGNIYIVIEDDGRGLDRDAIIAKARERGIIQDGETMADRDVWNLIFEPGFSTAKQITDVSGRGVGMDVVRRNIESLRGHVEIHSEKGKGSRFSIRLPLTLAIIDGMVVEVGKERFIIPTLSIVMSVRPEPADLATVVQRGEMLKHQGDLVPLFRLSRLFGIQNAIEDPTEALVVVIEDEGHRVGILVDELVGQQQIVIKSLGESMQGIPGIAGGAIMPDGTVGLIVDVGSLVKVSSGSHERETIGSQPGSVK